jgi:protein involved in polysaccharide export with SLBB domain
MICLILFSNSISYAATGGEKEPSEMVASDPHNNNMAGSSEIMQTSGMQFMPGDGLWISTFPDTSSFLNRTFPIDDRGYVEFPLVGKVQVSAMTEQQIVSFIKNNFRQYTRSPHVTIKPMLRISMIGGFIRPGLYYVEYDNSFWNTIRLSGGPSLEDGIKDMQWERDGESMMDDLTPFFERGISLRNMGFKSGDILWTPSPTAETTGDQILKYGLPIITVTTSLIMMWLYYQQTLLIYTSR